MSDNNILQCLQMNQIPKRRIEASTIEQFDHCYKLLYRRKYTNRHFEWVHEYISMNPTLCALSMTIDHYGDVYNQFVRTDISHQPSSTNLLWLCVWSMMNYAKTRQQAVQYIQMIKKMINTMMDRINILSIPSHALIEYIIDRYNYLPINFDIQSPPYIEDSHFIQTLMIILIYIYTRNEPIICIKKITRLFLDALEQYGYHSKSMSRACIQLIRQAELSLFRMAHSGPLISMDHLIKYIQINSNFHQKLAPVISRMLYNYMITDISNIVLTY